MLKTITAFLALALAGALIAEEFPKSAKERARAELIEHIRDRIVWHDEERTRPFLIPVDLFSLVPLADFPIPDGPKHSLMGSVALRVHWRSPTGGEYGDCEPPAFSPSVRAEIPEEEKITLEKLIAEAAVAVVVQIDRTTTVWWHNGGVHEYCEVSVRKFLRGENFNPYTKNIKGFLAPGGEFMLEGARICTINLWHTKPPSVGANYLLIGAPDKDGTFYAVGYFPVTEGAVDWVPYSQLRRWEKPVSLEILE